MTNQLHIIIDAKFPQSHKGELLELAYSQELKMTRVDSFN